jgi:CDP-diacylglycerol--glycerol-3-phosphate 3-phosphatidyltransferase
LFIIAAVVTIYDLAEEIILALLLNEWKTDVHGIWWVLNGKDNKL